jgi:hypothetical protein
MMNREGKRRMVIHDVEGDNSAIEYLKKAIVRIVDKVKLLNLLPS